MVYILVMVSSTSGGFLLTLSPICTGFDDFMGVNVGGAAPHEARWFVVRVDVPIRPDEFFF